MSYWCVATLIVALENNTALRNHIPVSKHTPFTVIPNRQRLAKHLGPVAAPGNRHYHRVGRAPSDTRTQDSL